jgi:hypothetical protein
LTLAGLLHESAKFNRLHLLFRNDETLIDKTARASPWTPAAFSSELPGIEGLRCRDVAGASATWTVFSADVRVPANLSRARKATSKSTPVSIAISSNDEPSFRAKNLERI